ncbi:oxidoreductase [Hymenopellis radicata]|nr:oxidoreductase [Hymenopellis radicata]
MVFGFGKKWNPEGLHVYITGGSQGLGLSFATIMVKKGAHVSIVARNQDRLTKAVELLKTHQKSADQKIHAYSYSLFTAKESTDALNAACVPFDGKAPDAIIACAGGAHPKFFVEMTEEDLDHGMKESYWVQAWTAWAAAKMMVRQKRYHDKSKIVLVSSMIGLMTYVGWSNYSPGKFALRALGDALQSELMLYTPNISVHTYFPPTMFTASYEEENRSKPAITKDIEGADDGQTADQAAQAMWRGLERGDAHITGDLLTDILRAGTRGTAPKNNWVVDAFLDWLSFMLVPVWRASVDRKVKAHAKEHEQYLQDKGFFEMP